LLTKQNKNYRRQIERLKDRSEELEREIRRVHQDAEFERDDLKLQIQMMSVGEAEATLPRVNKSIQTADISNMEDPVHEQLLQQQRLIAELEERLYTPMTFTNAKLVKKEEDAITYSPKFIAMLALSFFPPWRGGTILGAAVRLVEFGK